MRNKVLISLVSFLYLTNQFLLGLVYPDRSTDYFEFVKYYNTRMCIYEVMFLVFFLMIYYNFITWIKYLAYFMVVLSAGSVFDKVFLNNNNYLWSDIILIIIGLILTYVQIKRRT